MCGVQLFKINADVKRKPGMVYFGFRSTRCGKSSIANREYKSREVAQSPMYVILHSLLEVSFCTQPFPTPSGGLWS